MNAQERSIQHKARATGLQINEQIIVVFQAAIVRRLHSIPTVEAYLKMRPNLAADSYKRS